MNAAAYEPARLLFNLGRTVITATAQVLLTERNQMPLVQTILSRHVLGDWGDVCEEDAEANDRALETGGRLMSVYKIENGPVLWVITEWDRSYTTVLLPEDY